MDYTSHIGSPIAAALSTVAPRTADVAGLRIMGFIFGSVTAAVVMVGTFVVTTQIRHGFDPSGLEHTASYTAPVAATPDQQHFDISVYTGYGRAAEPLALGGATSVVSGSLLPAALR